jgi:oligopeptide/dipeptide ABC transporter ATP-binding protein
MTSGEVILEANELTVVLGGRGGFLRKKQRAVRAVDGVSLAVRRGETVGIVGESGCGKTTLARTLLGMVRETSGEIRLHSSRVDGVDPKSARVLRRAIQYLHQDAGGSLDPWWSVGKTILETMAINNLDGDRGARLDEVLLAVGLDPAVKPRYPHQLSGGQLRRVALARLLVLLPEILILDEPTAGLDLSIQATVLRLLLDVKQTFNVTNLFISHDMSVVKLICDRVAVMYRGRIVEEGRTADLFAQPCHPYTRALIAAAPTLTAAAPAPPPRRPAPESQVMGGCAYRTRCPQAIAVCDTIVPLLAEAGTPDARVACHNHKAAAQKHRSTSMP